MKKLIFGLIILLASPSLLFAQITSTTAGGNWSDASTWLGGVVPTATDNVVIDGTVYHSNKSDACLNLIINNEKTLTSLKANLGGWPLKVGGDLINNGIIRNNDAGNRFQLSISKNITNNGAWTNYGVSLIGDSDQVISGTEPFASYFIMVQNKNRIIAGSDISFSGTSLLFYGNNEFIIEPDKTVSFFYSATQVQGEFMPPNNMTSTVHFKGGGKVIVVGSKYSISGSKFDGVTLIKE